MHSAGVMRQDDLPTPPATRGSRYVRVLVICTRCHAQAPQAIVGEGRGDTLTKVWFRCLQCGSDRTDFMMVAREW